MAVGPELELVLAELIVTFIAKFAVMAAIAVLRVIQGFDRVQNPKIAAVGPWFVIPPEVQGRRVST